MLEGRAAGIVVWKHHACFHLLQFGITGSGQQWFANAGLRMVAILAASESPGLFVKITCPLAPIIEILIY